MEKEKTSNAMKGMRHFDASRAKRRLKLLRQHHPKLAWREELRETLGQRQECQLAKTGRRAITEPVMTIKRSIEIAPRMIGLDRT